MPRRESKRPRRDSRKAAGAGSQTETARVHCLHTGGGCLIGTLDFEASCSQRLLSELVAEHFARLAADELDKQLAGRQFGPD